jgi:hypothetical protein
VGANYLISQAKQMSFASKHKFDIRTIKYLNLLRIFCLASVLEIHPFSKCFPDRARGHIPPHATPPSSTPLCIHTCENVLSMYNYLFSCTLCTVF